MQSWGQIDPEEFNKLMSVNVYGALKVSEVFSKNIVLFVLFDSFS